MSNEGLQRQQVDKLQEMYDAEEAGVQASDAF
jgi:hypothetical protein